MGDEERTRIMLKRLLLPSAAQAYQLTRAVERGLMHVNNFAWHLCLDHCVCLQCAMGFGYPRRILLELDQYPGRIPPCLLAEAGTYSDGGSRTDASGLFIPCPEGTYTTPDAVGSYTVEACLSESLVHPMLDGVGCKSSLSQTCYSCQVPTNHSRACTGCVNRFDL